MKLEKVVKEEERKSKLAQKVSREYIDNFAREEIS